MSQIFRGNTCVVPLATPDSSNCSKHGWELQKEKNYNQFILNCTSSKGILLCRKGNWFDCNRYWLELKECLGEGSRHDWPACLWKLFSFQLSLNIWMSSFALISDNSDWHDERLWDLWCEAWHDIVFWLKQLFHFITVTGLIILIFVCFSLFISNNEGVNQTIIWFLWS